MTRVLFAKHDKQKLSILPNIFALFLVVSIGVISLLFGGLSLISFSPPQDVSLEEIKRENIKAIEALSVVDNAPRENTLRVSAFTQEVKKNIDRASDTLRVGGVVYFLTEDCVDIQSSIDGCDLYAYSETDEIITYSIPALAPRILSVFSGISEISIQSYIRSENAIILMLKAPFSQTFKYQLFFDTSNGTFIT